MQYLNAGQSYLKELNWAQCPEKADIPSNNTLKSSPKSKMVGKAETAKLCTDLKRQELNSVRERNHGEICGHEKTLTTLYRENFQKRIDDKPADLKTQGRDGCYPSQNDVLLPIKRKLVSILPCLKSVLAKTVGGNLSLSNHNSEPHPASDVPLSLVML